MLFCMGVKTGISHLSHYKNKCRQVTYRRKEVTGEWRKLDNEDLQNLHSPNIIKLIKPRRMR
jgi:hypothetical protein